MNPRAITLFVTDPSAAARQVAAAFGWEVESDFGTFASIATGDDALPIWLNAPGSPGEESSQVVIHVAAEDVDAAFESAVAAGGKSAREPQDMDYGERSAYIELEALPGITFDLSKPLDVVGHDVVDAGVEA